MRTSVVLAKRFRYTAYRSMGGEGASACTCQTFVEESVMQLGNFSVSLAVKDIEASRAFYEKFGFSLWGGDPQQKWVILKNGSTVIGLFQGMFERNLLTFNPGWDGDGNALPEFTDIRDLQRELKARGVPLLSEVDESSAGPASCMVQDPDGNQILLDQHV